MVENGSICVVIVTFNGMQWIEECLLSCAPYHIVVIDNNSSDGTTLFIAQNFPEVHLFCEDKNLGFGAANNKGISFALSEGADAVFLLNQDAYLFPDTIEKLADFSIKNPDFGVLSPIHYQVGKEKLDPQFSNYITYPKNNYFIADAIKGSLKTVYEVPFINAAAWFLPRKTLETVGGFDPIFFHYGEDENYCQRVRYHDLKIGVVTTADVVHDRGERRPQVLKPYSCAFLQRLEKSFKVSYANINRTDIYFNSSLSIKAVIAAFVNLDLDRLRYILKLKRKKKQWFEECLRSRAANTKKGALYLKI